jgi:CPA2 family monovalent cation:H+ antiporter-2
VIAESHYRAQVVAEVLPLRDLFASLFFVSVGMLINPALLAADLWQVALMASVVVAGKVVIVTAVVRLLRLPGRVALLSGLNVAQVGEFSFVLGAIGVASGVLPVRFFELVLLTAFITIVATPFLLGAAPALLTAIRWLPLVGRWFDDPVEDDPASGKLRGHTVICGFGRVGRELGAVLDSRRLPYLVVDYSRDEVLALRARGVPAVYGDAANPAVLAHTRLRDARALAVLIPDSRAAALVTRHARQVSPRLDIVTRIADIREAGRLRAAGASEVVQPEFEAGIEVIAHVMRRYGVSGSELAQILDVRRQALQNTDGDSLADAA